MLKKGSLILLLLVLAVTAFVFSMSNCYKGTVPIHPTDKELEQVLWDYEADFDELISMSYFDKKVIRIAPEFTWLEKNASWPRPVEELGFSQERWEQYRRLFKKLGVREGLVRYPDSGTTILIASSEGMLTGGSSKGYAYSIEKLPTIEGSLDDLVTSPPLSRRVYKRVNDRWYLYYDFE